MSILKNLFGLGRTAQEHYNKGNALRRSRDYGAALKCYDKAIQLDATFHVAYTNRGLTKGDLGDYLGAISDFDRS